MLLNYVLFSIFVRSTYYDLCKAFQNLIKMGSVGSKSHLERRNSVVRRTQRKSIHGIKAKVDNLSRDIKRFNGVSEDGAFQELHERLERLKFDLVRKEKELQPQVIPIYNETFMKIKNCRSQLSEKLAKNQEKSEQNDDVISTIQSVQSESNTLRDEELEEATNLEQSTDKRRTVELKIVQIQSPESTRASVMKMGVPVLPKAMQEAKEQHQATSEEQLSFIRTNIEHLEMEISEFVGKKDGKHYNRIKDKLLAYQNQLSEVKKDDEEIAEQITLCGNYIHNCISFLDEKAIEDREDSDDEVFTPQSPELQLRKNNKTVQAVVEPVRTSPMPIVNDTMAPRGIKTTYI